MAQPTIVVPEGYVLVVRPGARFRVMDPDGIVSADEAVRILAQDSSAIRLVPQSLLDERKVLEERFSVAQQKIAERIEAAPGFSLTITVQPEAARSS